MLHAQLVTDKNNMYDQQHSSSQYHTVASIVFIESRTLNIQVGCGRVGLRGGTSSNLLGSM